jgi:hypothetical protein
MSISFTLEMPDGHNSGEIFWLTFHPGEKILSENDPLAKPGDGGD